MQHIDTSRATSSSSTSWSRSSCGSAPDNPAPAGIHHDLREVSQGVVLRRLGLAETDHTTVLELAHGCMSCTLREDVLPLLRELGRRRDVHRIVLQLDPGLEPEQVCWSVRHVLVDGAPVTDAVQLRGVITIVDVGTWLATRPDTALWLESAGGRLRIDHAGDWLAAGDADAWHRAHPERRALAALRWHDRAQNLVILVHDADPDHIKDLTADRRHTRMGDRGADLCYFPTRNDNGNGYHSSEGSEPLFIDQSTWIDAKPQAPGRVTASGRLPSAPGLGPVRRTMSTTTAGSVSGTAGSSRRRFLITLGGLLVTTPIVLVAAVSIGAVAVPPGQVWSSVFAHLLGRVPQISAINDQIIWQVRAPRVLLAFVVGAGLAVAGAVLQAVVRNPLADPYVLGVSSGAAVAAVAVLTLGGVAATGFLPAIGVSGAAFVGAIVTLALVIVLGRRQRQLDPYRLLLAGVALSYLFQAGTSYLQLRVGPNQLGAVLFWLLGTVSGADWDKLVLPAIVVMSATLLLTAKARQLNALLLGDETAASLGVSVSRLRTQLLVITAALTATVISVAGGVGFVGLIAPHCVRLLIGANHRRLLPATALLGGVFLVLADLLSRVMAQPLELPLSIVTAIAGVPFFLVLLRRSGRDGVRP